MEVSGQQPAVAIVTPREDKPTPILIGYFASVHIWCMDILNSNVVMSFHWDSTVRFLDSTTV
jgi:hypothetical protein